MKRKNKIAELEVEMTGIELELEDFKSDLENALQASCQLIMKNAMR